MERCSQMANGSRAPRAPLQVASKPQRTKTKQLVFSAAQEARGTRRGWEARAAGALEGWSGRFVRGRVAWSAVAAAPRG